jgi:M6 family metalloprotease-like protein
MKIFTPSIRSILLVYSLFFMSALASAAPHYGTEMLLKQPDGSLVKVKVYGDEYYQRIESMDGYTLIRNAKGWICYAIIRNDQKDFASTDILYKGKDVSTIKNFPSLKKGLALSREVVSQKRREIKTKLEANAPALKPRHREINANARGTTVDYVKGLAVIIDFADEPGTITKDAIERYFNSAGYNEFYNNGSVRDYYLEVSSGLLDYSNIVVGYYRAQKPKSYYDCNTSFGNTYELIEETYQWLDQQGFDFSTLTTQNGEVRAVNFFYAGYPTQGWTYGLWPHMSYHGFTTNDGVTTGRYQITNIGGSLTLATTCHENGHMVMGWPDLYDYGYDGFTSAGLGLYCLMAYQGASNNPVPPNPFLRNSAGWENITDISSYIGDITLPSNINSTFKYDNPTNPNEYFLVENRTKTGRNESLPDEGMMIWHIDQGGYNEYQDMTPDKHFQVSLEQADGNFDLEHASSYGDANDFFSADYKNAFNDFTLPDATWWNGTRSNLSISNISAIGSTMTATIGESVNTLPAPSNAIATITGSTFSLSWQDNTVNESGFKIERKLNADAYQLIGIVGENVTSFIDNSNTNALGVYTYRVYAYNATSASPYSNETSVQQLQSPYWGYPTMLPSILDAEIFDNGGEGIAYHDVDGNNAGNQYRNEAVDIEACSEGGYSVGWIRTGEWMEYAITAPSADYYEVSIRVASDASTGSFHLEFDGVDKTGLIKVSSTGGWQTWTTLKSTVYLNEGTQLMRMYADGYDFNINYYAFNNKPHVAITAPSTNSTFAQPASVAITADASDVNGGISKVEFYQGNTLLGVSTSYPYTYTWENVVAGNYTLTAVAYDYEDASTVSEPVTINVSAASNNLALNKPVTFSSIETSALTGANAVDGNGSTRWSSAFTDQQYFVVDLGSAYNIERVKISWETALGKNYQIQFSTDNATWTTAKDITNNTSLINDITGLSGSARYVKMNGITRGTPYGYSIYEFEVYGNASVPAVNLAYDKNFVTSSDENSNYTGNKAIDADGTTRWSSAFSEPQYIIVDLGAMYTINTVKLSWEVAYAKNFQVQVSANNATWTTVRDISNNTVTTHNFTDLNAFARYVKIYCINRATPYGFSIYELEVYGTPATAPAMPVHYKEENNSFSVYPIPAKDQFTLVMPDDLNEEIFISILNTLSQTVSERNVDTSFEKRTSFEVADWASGIYFLSIKTRNGILKKKIYIKS